jgi:hypothetical protein
MDKRDHLALVANAEHWAEVKAVLPGIVFRAPWKAAGMIVPYTDKFAADLLTLVNPAQAQRILQCLTSERRQKVSDVASLAIFLGPATWLL